MRLSSRFLASPLTLAALLALAFTPPAHATDVVWRTVFLPWASYGAGTAATGDSTRLQHLGDENDSTRTAPISTSDWAWDAVGGIGAAAGPVNIAVVECDCNVDNLAAGNDSIYIAIEKRGRNGRYAYNTTITAAAGTVLARQGAHGNNTRAIFRGPLQWDNDGAETVNLLAPGSDFRIVVKGDQSATSPALGGCMLSITYPSRRASQ